MKPIIGITTYKEKRDRGYYDSINHNYASAVLKAGGIPVLIPTIKDIEFAKNYIDNIDGLIFSGGVETIHPLIFGENPTKDTTMVNPERDYWEISLFKEGYKRDLPILGICRGNQLINVAMEGTLYQHIPSEIEDAIGHFSIDSEMKQLFHKVLVTNESKLYNIFKNNEIVVNSFHNQSVKRLGDGLKVIATSDDGIVEGIEAVDKSFIIGLQFHPEALVTEHTSFLEIFNTLVNRARNKKFKGSQS